MSTKSRQKRQRTEEALSQTLNKLHLAQEAAKSGTWEWILSTGENVWSEETWQLYGLKPHNSKASFKLWLETIHPEDREMAKKAVNQAAKNLTELNVEYRLSDKLGKNRWLMSRGQPQKNAQGIVDRYIGVIIDITERKKVEEALQQQAQLLHLSYDAIIVWRKDGNIEQWNRGAEQLYGYTQSEALGQITHKLLKTIHPIPLPEIEAAMRKNGQWEGELRHFAKNGHEVTVSARHQLVLGTDGIERVLETNRDITERKKMEKALRENEEKYRNIVETATEVILIVDAQARIVFVNDRFSEMFGYSKEEALHMSHFDLVFPEDMVQMKKRWESRKRGRKESYELRLRRKDDSPAWVLVGVAPNFGIDRKFLGTLTMLADITERTVAEKALRESEKDLKRAQAVAKTGSWRFDGQSNKLLWSDETYKMFEISNRTPLTFETYLSFVHPEDSEYVNRKRQSPVKGKPFDVEHRIIVNGQVKWVRVRAEFEFDDEGFIRSGFGTVQDITESVNLRKKLEEYSTQMEQLASERAEKLKEAERLATIGATAGMVGHDIRNPLQAIVSGLYIAKSDLAEMPDGQPKEGLRESLAEIEKNIDYINKIVQDLQDYAKPIAPATKETNIKTIFDEVLIRKAIPQEIRIARKIEPEAEHLITDPDLLKRILTNLVNNAIQAMPEGGKLTMKAFRETDNLVITVEDTGVGIPENIKHRLFTPLFTTKSKGQGFGLAAVKRLTQTLGGTVVFESETGNGTKFIVRFPQKNKQ